MKMKLILASVFLIVSSTQVLAARPSINELNTRVNQLEAENNAQQAEIDALNERVTDLEVCAGSASAPTRFVDNGDGTICDNQTGLMWEKKDAEDGFTDLTNPHDADNGYTWAKFDSDPDGTAFTDFLQKLNSDATNDPEMVGFADHTDWRLPNIVELQTIVDCSFGFPCIDPIFGPTAMAFYWSSTSLASDPRLAWFVDFVNGVVSADGKAFDFRVRAVRGGR